MVGAWLIRFNMHYSLGLVAFWTDQATSFEGLLFTIYMVFGGALSEAHAGKIRTAKVNTDENQQLAMRYSIFSIPTLIVFRNGREAARLVGYMPQAAMEERLRDFLA